MKSANGSFPASRRIAIGGALIALLALGSPAQAQGWGGGWARPGWGGSAWRGPYWDSPYPQQQRSSQRDSREGRVDVSRFVVDDADAAKLGKGPIAIDSRSAENPAVSAEPIAGAPPGPPSSAYRPADAQASRWMPPAQRSTYEAAVLDAFVGVGYDTIHADDPAAQVASIQIDRRMLTPAEEKRNPVSGSAAMSVGTYGSAYGLAVNVDLTKPRSALVSTRMTMQIRDHADGKVLWEGHAEIATRDGDDDWTDGAIATRLASALLDRFPEGEKVEPIAAAPIANATPVPAAEAPASSD